MRYDVTKKVKQHAMVFDINTSHPVQLALLNATSFYLDAEREQLAIEGNASAIDLETDREIADAIYAQLANGNIWAWCSVTLTAHCDGKEGTDHLGACSYKSMYEFCQLGGYFDDMVGIAWENLIKELSAKELMEI